MGCGKSTVGKELSRLFSYKFIDLDDYIEVTQGRSISDIFSSEGEEKFRVIEALALKEILANNPTENNKLILSLGGGTVVTPENRTIITEGTCCIYLKAKKETLINHLSNSKNKRPLLNNKNHGEIIDSLMLLRGPIYEEVATQIYDVDGMSSKEVAEEIFYTYNIK